MDRLYFRVPCCLLFVLVFLSGCGGGSSGSSSDTPAPQTPSALACDSINLPASANALSLIPVDGLDESLKTVFFDEGSAVYAAFSDQQSTTAAVYSPLIEDADGDLQLGIPILPDAPYDKVTRQVELVFGDLTCGGFEMSVSGLEEGEPQLVENFMTDYRTAIELRAAAIDPSLSDWADILAVKEQYLAGTSTLSSDNLVFVLMLADSLETMTETVAGLSDDERLLLASWMEQMGYVDSGGTAVSGLSLPAPVAYPQFLSALNFSGTEPVQILNTSGGCPIVGEGGVNITTAESLNEYMQQQKDAEDTLSGFSGDIRQLGMTSTPLIGLASGGAGLAAGAALFLEFTYQEYLVHSLPSRLDGLDFEITPGVRIEEDYELVNSNQSAFWSDARVNASSRDWNLTGVAIDLIAQSVGAAKFFNGMTKVQGAGAGAKGFVEDVITNEVVNRLKATNPEAECLSVPARTWTNIDVTSDEWTRGDVGPEGVLAAGLRTTLSGLLGLLKTGTTEVYVETLPEKFGGRTAVANKFVQVVPARLSASPTFKRVTNPGETVSFQFSIADTLRPELAPQATEVGPGLTVVAGPNYLGANQYEIEVATPSDPGQYPATLTLARDPVLDPMTPRSLQLTVVNREVIEVSPEQACVRANEDLDLTARLEGFAAGTEPFWRLVSGPGQVNGTGLISGTTHGAVYRSGSTGQATVEAWALDSDGEEVAARSTVFIGACDARVHVWHSLNVRASAPGEQDQFEFDGEVLELPTRPATFWSGRTEQEGRPVSASGSLEFSDGTTTQVVFQQTSGQAIGTWQVDGKGTTTFDLDFQASDQCDDDPTGQSDLINCSNTDAAGVATPYYFIDLDQARNYQLNISVECQTTGDTGLSIFLLTNLIRFDANNTVLAPNFDPNLTEAEQQYANGQITDFTTVGQNCGTGQGGVDINETIRLVGPTTGETETLVLTSALLFSAANKNNPEPVGTSVEEVAGSYTGTATINASFDFFPVQD